MGSYLILVTVTIQAGEGPLAWWEASTSEANIFCIILAGLAASGAFMHAILVARSLAFAFVRCCLCLGELLSGAVYLVKWAGGWTAVVSTAILDASVASVTTIQSSRIRASHHRHRRLCVSVVPRDFRLEEHGTEESMAAALCDAV